MKRFILVLILIISTSGLFAKDKKFFEKNSKYSFIGLYESSNLKDTDGYKYYIVINEDDFEGGRLLYTVVCNEYDKIKAFLTDMYRAGNKAKEPVWAFYPDYYSFLHDDLVLAYENTEIDSKNNMLVEQKIYILE